MEPRLKVVRPDSRAPRARLSVVIPVYNEQETILEVIRRVQEVPLPVDREIVVVDDGSTDRTREFLLDALENGGRFRLHLMPWNQGKGACIRAGFELAAGDILMVQDADLELDPAEIPSLLAPLLEGSAAVVYGSRFLEKPVQWTISNLGNRFMTWVSNVLFRGGITDLHTCYKAFRREVIRATRLECRRFEFEPEITAKLLRKGHRIVEVPISYSPRSVADGKKVRARDGIECIWTLLRWRMTPVSALVAAAAPGGAGLGGEDVVSIRAGARAAVTVSR